MVKIVKFPLLMKKEEVRRLEEFKKYFDINAAVKYFNDGRLLRWLKSRRYYEEASKVEKLSRDDSQFGLKLAAIFGVGVTGPVVIDDESHERLMKLKQYTSDSEILERVDQVAFNQTELEGFIDEYNLIYLCGNTFRISLKVINKTYIGVGTVTAIIPSNHPVDFARLHIDFRNISFDDEYNEVLRQILPSQLYNEGDVAYDAGNYKVALEKFKNAAELDYAPAFGAVGLMYLRGEGVEENPEEAERYFNLGAEKNDGTAFFGLGLLNFENDADKAFEMFQQAVDFEEALGHYYLGVMYRDGIGIEKNLQTAFEHFRDGDEAGDIGATRMLGLMYYNGEYVQENLVKAFELYEKAADAGDVKSMVYLGKMYYEGEGVNTNLIRAFELYETAASAGDAEAMVYIGKRYQNGEYVDKNLREAFKWYKKSANREFPMGMCCLANMYLRGEGTEKNITEGIALLRKAADVGYSGAMLMLGLLWDTEYKDIEDNAIKKDISQAFQWYLRAARADNIAAIVNVGACFLWGEGTKENLLVAEMWLEKAVRAGNPYGYLEYANLLYKKNKKDSQITELYEIAANAGVGRAAYNLSKMYREGNGGVSKDKAEAKYWEDRAKRLGFESGGIIGKIFSSERTLLISNE